MGINVYSNSGDIAYGVREFVIDTTADLKLLPKNCEMGSSALCLENGEVYFYSYENGWVIPGAIS